MEKLEDQRWSLEYSAGLIYALERGGYLRADLSARTRENSVWLPHRTVRSLLPLGRLGKLTHRALGGVLRKKVPDLPVRSNQPE